MTGRVAINIKQNMTEELEKNNAITKEEMHHPKDEWHGHIKQGMCVCVCVCGGGGGGSTPPFLQNVSEKLIANDQYCKGQ